MADILTQAPLRSAMKGEGEPKIFKPNFGKISSSSLFGTVENSPPVTLTSDSQVRGLKDLVLPFVTRPLSSNLYGDFDGSSFVYHLQQNTRDTVLAGYLEQASQDLVRCYDVVNGFRYYSTSWQARR